MLRQCQIAFNIPANENENKILILKDIVDAHAYASGSVIVSMASYICWKYYHLLNPDFLQDKIKLSSEQQSYPSPFLSLHPLFQTWIHSLCAAVLSRNAIRCQNTLYILLKAPVEYEAHLKKDTDNYEEFLVEKGTKIQDIFKIKAEFSNKKIGYINISKSQLNTDRFQPRINVLGVLLGTIFNNDSWDQFFLLKDKIPSAEELSNYDTLIIPGSTNSIMDYVKPVEQFTVEMMKAYHQSQKLKILGLCYGHQLIARQFNAQVVKKPRFGGLQKVRFNQSVKNLFSFLQCLPKVSLVAEHHEDFVESVPEGFYLLGQSESCKVEALLSKNGRILSFQFHPQYFSEYTIAYGKRLNSVGMQTLKKFDLLIKKQSADFHYNSTEGVRQCMIDFIKW